MIEVTRLNNSKLWVNAEMIEFVEATPDTIISLVNGDKIIVKEPPPVVIQAIIMYRQQTFPKLAQLTEKLNQFIESKEE